MLMKIMKKSMILFLLLFLFPFITNAQEWDTFDKGLFVSLIAFHTADFLQTNYIFDHQNEYYEKDIIIKKGVDQIGKSFIPFYLASLAGIEFLIANDIKSSFGRKTALFLFNINAFSFVKSNYDIGIGLKFWF